MEVEIFTLSDSSYDYSGKLVIVGAFDTIFSNTFPCIHPTLSITLRLRFTLAEIGSHQIKLAITGANNQMIIPPIDAPMNMNLLANNNPTNNPIPDEPAINFIANYNGIRFDIPGKYKISLYINGNLKSSIPLSLIKR